MSNLSLAGSRFNPLTGEFEPIQQLPYSNASGSYGPQDQNPVVNKNIPMNSWEKFGIGANALTGLAGAYSAYKQTGLMEDQLKMQRSLANRNIENSALTTNAQLRKAASTGAQMTTGASQGDESYQLAYDRLYNPVNGTPVV